MRIQAGEDGAASGATQWAGGVGARKIRTPGRQLVKIWPLNLSATIPPVPIVKLVVVDEKEDVWLSGHFLDFTSHVCRCEIMIFQPCHDRGADWHRICYSIIIHASTR